MNTIETMLKNKLKCLFYRARGEITTDELIRRGLKVGSNFERLNQVMIDDSHPWLIEIGDDVTLAPRVQIIAHDASTKKFLGYTKIGRVIIGNRVFIGASTVILPSVTIGDDVIIGANSTVTGDLPSGVVAAGNPARVMCTTNDYLSKEKKRMNSLPVYDKKYTLREGISDDLRQKQREEITGQGGFVE